MTMMEDARKLAAETKSVAMKSGWLRGGPFIAGVFASLLFGCGSVEVPTDVVACGPVEAPTDVVAACHDLFLRRVAFAQRCTGPGAPPSSADEEAYVDSCAGIATAPGVTVLPIEIKACADQMDTSPCLGGGVFPSCAGYGGDLLYFGHEKKGTLAPGEGCFAGVQCDSGYCDNFGQACGVCNRARAVGESCGDATDLCVEGRCTEGTCQLSGKKPGEDCIDYAGGDCQAALYCKRIDPAQIEGKCAPRGQAGAPCGPQNGDECADGLSCPADVCVIRAADGAGCSDNAMCSSFWCNGGTCTTKPTGLTEGEDCSVGYCRADLLCDESQTCAAPTYLPEGAACTISSFPKIMCKPELFCHVECSPSSECEDAGVCRPDPQPGENCTSFASCASGAVCVGFDSTDLTKGLCVKRGRAGEACPCADDLACVSGVCVAYSAACICQ